MTSVFADFNSTTPLCEPVVDAFLKWRSIQGNMSSAHHFGQRIHGIYDDAVDQIRGLLNASQYDVFTCASATEANYWWIYSLLNQVKGVPRVIASAIEHPCVLEPLQHYANAGVIDLKLCPVNAKGIVDIDAFKALLNSSTLFVSVMFANNEIGSIQPMKDIVDSAHAVGALVHSDIVQAAGKIPLDLDALGLDAISLSSHKCYAPTGCGVLMVKNTTLLKPLFLGGSQQQKLRAGTVNVMGLDLFATGLTYCYQQLPTHLKIHEWGQSLCDDFDFLKPVIPIDSEFMLWNTLPLAVSGHISHDAMMRFDLFGVAVATGSACSTGAVDVSPVIDALELPVDMAGTVIRFSFGYTTTESDLNQIQSVLSKLIQ